MSCHGLLRVGASSIANSAHSLTSQQRSADTDNFLVSGWSKIAAARLKCAKFNMQTMLKYFLDTVAGDGQSSSNFKAISATDNKFLRLFERGYVQRIEVVAVHDMVHYRVRYEPEMKDHVAPVSTLQPCFMPWMSSHSMDLHVTL